MKHLLLSLPVMIAGLSNLDEGIAYVPTVGYFKKGEDQPFAPTCKVKDSSIKILRCPTPFLNVNQK